VNENSTKSLEKIREEVEENSLEKTKKRPHFVKSKDRFELKGISEKSGKTGKTGKITRLKKEESSNLLVIDTE
jgi:hypothetical protein